MKLDVVLERVNKGMCPICKEKLEEPISFIEHNGSKQPVHQRHIQFKENHENN